MMATKSEKVKYELSAIINTAEILPQSTVVGQLIDLLTGIVDTVVELEQRIQELEAGVNDDLTTQVP